LLNIGKAHSGVTDAEIAMPCLVEVNTRPMKSNQNLDSRSANRVGSGRR
jgi:hypothetical protein